MKSLVLFFFLLILSIFFNYTPDAIHKHGRFSKVFLKKGFKLVQSQKNSFIIFDSGLILLPAKVDLIPKKQDCKKDAFMIFGFSSFEKVFVLLTKVVTFYVYISKI